LKCINRLIEPDHGEVFVGDDAVLALAPHVLRRRIGYVFQGVGLFPHLSVGANIGITPGTPRALYHERIDPAVRELLDMRRKQASRVQSVRSQHERESPTALPEDIVIRFT
jgi:osmoprotectant transport system ATP-binding protein